MPLEKGILGKFDKKEGKAIIGVIHCCLYEK